MTSLPTTSPRSLLAGMAVLLLAAACSSAPAAPGGSSKPPGTTSGPAATLPAGGGGAAEDPEAAIEAAIARMTTLGSYRFSLKIETASGPTGELRTVDVVGIIRTAPVAATRLVVSSSDTTNTWIAIGDKGWFNTKPGPDEYVDTTAAQLAKQNRDYLWSTIQGQLHADKGSYDPVAAETVNGVQAVHFTLSESRRAKRAEILKVKVEDVKGDVWITPSGQLVRYLDGQISTASSKASGQIVSYDVLEANCACPVEPPA